MKCITCSADIPPAWVHALRSGVCPGCGGPLMPEESKQLMDELREAMVQMTPLDAEAIAGWILSNYHISKIGSTVEPTNFHRKLDGPAATHQGLKVAPNQAQAQRFMKLAGADKMIRDPKLAAVVEAINSAQNDDNMYGNEETQAQEELESTEDENEHLRQVVAAAKRKGHKVTARQLLENNVPMNFGDGKQPLSSEEIEEVQSVFGSTSEEPSSKDPPNIQRDRLKRLMAQREIGSTGSVGLITRRDK